MANRSYLYSVSIDTDGKIIKANNISEQSYAIPINYQILVSKDTELVASELWEGALALRGKAKEGIERLKLFYKELLEKDIYDRGELKEAYDEFFEHLENNKLDYFLFEAYEIIVMEQEDPNLYTRQLLNGVSDYEYTKNNFFNYLGEEEDWYELGVDASDVLYYDLSKKQ